MALRRLCRLSPQGARERTCRRASVRDSASTSNLGWTLPSHCRCDDVVCRPGRRVKSGAVGRASGNAVGVCARGGTGHSLPDSRTRSHTSRGTHTRIRSRSPRRRRAGLRRRIGLLYQRNRSPRWLPRNWCADCALSAITMRQFSDDAVQSSRRNRAGSARRGAVVAWNQRCGTRTRARLERSYRATIQAGSTEASEYIHLATHGFFLGASCPSTTEGLRAVGGLVSGRDLAHTVCRRSSPTVLCCSRESRSRAPIAERPLETAMRTVS